MTATPHAEFPLGPFTPYDGNPILRPQGDGWESSGVYDPATVVEDGAVKYDDGTVRDTWFAYYGQSDSRLGVATYRVGDTYGSLR